MLTFTHTYLIHLAYKEITGKNISLFMNELILGNVIPDFITHLGREKYQAIVHDLSVFTSLQHRSLFEWGAIFHILCDNYSTIGRLSFEGQYHEYLKDGFIEKLSDNVVINIQLNIPKRRILQCAFDILVIRDQKELLIDLLKSAEKFLHQNFEPILKKVASIYGIDQQHLKVGLKRFSHIYNAHFIEYAASEKYRLFPLIRSLLDLNSLTDPKLIFKEIDNHPELMELIEQNIGIINHNWYNLLRQTAVEVMKYPGMEDALIENLPKD